MRYWLVTLAHHRMKGAERRGSQTEKGLTCDYGNVAI